MEAVVRLIRQEEGVSLAEEGFLVLLVALACITALTTIGSSISNFFSGFATTLGAVGSKL